MAKLDGYTRAVTAAEIDRLLIGNLDEEEYATLLEAKALGHCFFVFQVKDSGKPSFLFSCSTMGELYRRRLIGRKEYIVREL